MPIITKKERISHMTELKDRKVVQHNDLITSVAKMDKTPLKIFELAVSCIDTENPPKDNIIYLSKSELYSFFEASDKDKGTRFKNVMKTMVKESVFQTKVDDKEVVFAPISYVEWKDRNDEVGIEFSKRIMPYIIELKRNFTQYAIIDIMNLESKYSIILYKWFSMNFNQFEKYELKGNRTQKQLKEYQNPKISIRELRALTDTLKEYPRFDNFESYIIKNSLKDIEKNTHFIVYYDKIKKGRSITDIQFHIEKKAHWKDEEYKRNDEVAQLSVENKERTRLEYYALGMSSPYTEQLITDNLITALDTINQETIIGLSKHVYPLYDELVKENGKVALREHLGYVSDNMVDYTASKKNIVKYLQISAQQYLDNGVGTIVSENKQQRAEEKKATRRKPVKEVPEWSNAKYVESTSDEEQARFAEWQKNMKQSRKDTNY
ncbi:MULTISPECIES: RepB family plasmid replication initiator protein [unclassified Lactococcus]|uniref:RepB family plasmid replication initiator protein n=1 Tax=unclassified Lactococcus TaxID=2643510 RepID=UPI0011C76F58|nr:MULTISPECIES: RepB family plasmid replication initiator protein [unclassified Lactococcus]MQW23413.1 RepB family plasmid replication initiator protein [Lactococcus sp. dk101]TXK37075.1 RepB family plasmid replication initiator protein [Lactococcus sp. dk310]TXK37307.1 RepB family plasmid replication initiator protein [Lactococcus sp. dk310]TXK47697.1 RepB family plasmid replication initiator protein [Lactococcus sp. dk322]